jgi:two-component system, OmpR family, response regulator VicR
VTEKPKWRIAYIEDDPDMIDLVRIILDADRFEVVGATNGRAGLALMHQFPPDVVLLDLMLPDMGGWTVYEAIKKDADLSELPVIVVTAQNTAIDRILGEQIAKVQVYLTKPFTPHELRAAVEKVLPASG